MTLIDVLSRPPRLPRALERPRLHDLLLGGPEPACLVVAPPGSGKTVAAAQALDAAAAQGGPGASPVRRGWCRLSPGAAGGADLVRLAAAALDDPVEQPGRGPLERAAALLDVLGEGPTTLVVDDYDLGRPEECDAVLAEVLALLPPRCRIVVCSAGRPAGLVGRASVGDWRLVGPGDLAFTTDEVAGLLTLLGQDPAAAPGLWSASGGWATAVALLAEAAATGSPGLAAAVEAILDHNAAGLDPTELEVLGMLSIVPSLGAAEMESLDLDPAALARLATRTALLRPVGDRWGLLDVARDPLQHRMGLDGQQQVAARVAPAVAATDPVAAAGILLDVGDDAAAGDLLARHASAVPPDTALPLLYRMRPEVRRRLPPSLSAARATVEMDTALAEAEQRLATARQERERVEAQVAVGAILVHRGQLASACTLLESALRAPRFTAVEAASAAVGWLGLARLWAGDLEGAAATVAGHGPGGSPGPSTRDGGRAGASGQAVDPSPLAPREPRGRSTPPAHPGQPVDRSPLALWVEAEVALARDDATVAAEAVGRLGVVGWACAAEATTARHALAVGAESAAAAAAARGYQAATVHGGFDLLVAAPVHAWCLARAGRWDEALAVADVLRRRMGAVDACARLHADLVAEAAARHGVVSAGAELGAPGAASAASAARRSLAGETPAQRRGNRSDAAGGAAAAGGAPLDSAGADAVAAAGRYRRAIDAVRRLGYAVVESEARRYLPQPADLGDRTEQGLRIGVLGPVVVEVDGKPVDDGAWRSRKAREVLLVAALAGEAGRSREEVIEAVWPERDPDRGRTLLRTALAEVRRVLEPARPPGEPSRFVVTHGDRIAVAANVDVAEVERLWAEARGSTADRLGGDPAGPGDGPHGSRRVAAVRALLAAWERFRGPVAADEPYTASLDDLRAEGERLQLEVADALVAAVGELPPPDLTTVVVDAAVEAVEHVVAAEPWRTEVGQQLAAHCRAAGHDAAAARIARASPST